MHARIKVSSNNIQNCLIFSSCYDPSQCFGLCSNQTETNIFCGEIIRFVTDILLKLCSDKITPNEDRFNLNMIRIKRRQGEGLGKCKRDGLCIGWI